MADPIVLDGAALTPDEVDAVARRGVPVALAPAARSRNQAARETIAALLERGEALYGATTGRETWEKAQGDITGPDVIATRISSAPYQRSPCQRE